MLRGPRRYVVNVQKWRVIRSQRRMSNLLIFGNAVSQAQLPDCRQSTRYPSTSTDRVLYASAPFVPL
jgi:hypothetical protein